MSIRRVKRYNVAMLRKDPRTLYVFGDNMQGKGKGGQAAIRDEPNAFGIPTKWKPTKAKSAYFTDADFDNVTPIIQGRFDLLHQHLKKGGRIVWPADDIGTGLAKLPETAPYIFYFIQQELAALDDEAAAQAAAARERRGPPVAPKKPEELDEDQIKDRAQQYAVAMEELGVEEPDWDDSWDVRRALVQLRERMAVSLGDAERLPQAPVTSHQTNLGTMEDTVLLMKRFRVVMDTLDHITFGSPCPICSAGPGEDCEGPEGEGMHAARTADLEFLQALSEKPTVFPEDFQRPLRALRSRLDPDDSWNDFDLYKDLGKLSKYLPPLDPYVQAVFFSRARARTQSPQVPELEKFPGFSEPFRRSLASFYSDLREQKGMLRGLSGGNKRILAYYRAWQDPSYLYDRFRMLRGSGHMFAFDYDEDGNVVRDPEGYAASSHADDAQQRYLAMRNPKKKANPLDTEGKAELTSYLQGRGDDDKVRRAIQSVATGTWGSDFLQNDKVAALFPGAGPLKSGTWDAEQRIPDALRQYDMVTRIEDMPGVPEGMDVQMDDPLGSEDSTAYLVQSLGLSLNEAKRVLGEMKASAQGRRNKKGQRVTIQPSSALIKPYRKRKMPYKLPKGMADAVGSHGVLVLMGPKEETPRVMTWRRGVHVDLDMVAKHPKELMQIFSRALQSAILWVGEKPVRAKQAHIYTGQVGASGSLLEVWAPGQPLSLQRISENLQKRKTVPWGSSGAAAQEKKAYADAAKTIRRAVRAPLIEEPSYEPPPEGPSTVVERGAEAIIPTTSEKRPSRASGREVAKRTVSSWGEQPLCGLCGAEPGQPCRTEKGKTARPHTGKKGGRFKMERKPRAQRAASKPAASKRTAAKPVSRASVPARFMTEEQAEEELGYDPDPDDFDEDEGMSTGLGADDEEASQSDSGWDDIDFNKLRGLNPEPMNMAERIKRALGWTGD